MKTLAAAALAAAVLLVAAGPASAGRGYERECGDQPDAIGVPWTGLEADNVSCRAAIRLANEYVSGNFENGFKGWRCRTKQLGREELKVKCERPKDGGQRVRFFYGA